MFRRTKTAPAPTEPTLTKEAGKGRPTPTRKEAEAAARARARQPRTRREQLAAQRSARTESSQKIRAAMKSGDERYYAPRDRGPVRKFVRDYVDSRFSFVELVLPLLLVTIVLSFTALATFASTLQLMVLLLVALDIVFLRLRLRRELRRRFPDESHKGATYYAVSRAMMMKFMRLPKPAVKIGQELPERYS